jgi:hypothetical protein
MRISLPKIAPFLDDVESLRAGLAELAEKSHYEDLDHALLGLRIVRHALEEVAEHGGLGGEITRTPEPPLHRRTSELTTRGNCDPTRRAPVPNIRTRISRRRSRSPGLARRGHRALRGRPMILVANPPLEQGGTQVLEGCRPLQREGGCERMVGHRCPIRPAGAPASP